MGLLWLPGWVSCTWHLVNVEGILQQRWDTNNTSMQMPHRPKRLYSIWKMSYISTPSFPLCLIKIDCLSCRNSSQSLKLSKEQQQSILPSVKRAFLTCSLSQKKRPPDRRKREFCYMLRISSSGNFHGWKSIEAVSIRDTGKNSMLVNQDHNCKKKKKTRRISSIHTPGFIFNME